MQFFSHVVLNDLQWFILVKFNNNISKNGVLELGDPRQNCQCAVAGIYKL